MAGVAALLLVSGCGGVEDTHVQGADRTACRALVSALPTHVSGQKLAERLPEVPGATWGDPSIVLRCGVGTPKDYDPTTGCQTADGLDWYVPAKGMNDQSADVVMTTIGRDPRVEVTLPAKYRPPVGAMVDLAPSIKAHTRRTTPCS